MGMTIDESITELEKARDSIEPYLFIDEAVDQSMKTAIETMCKYQKIEQIMKKRRGKYFIEIVQEIKEVLEDDNSTVDNSDM